MTDQVLEDTILEAKDSMIRNELSINNIDEITQVNQNYNDNDQYDGCNIDNKSDRSDSICGKVEFKIDVQHDQDI
jgi:hypothetical protein